MVNAFKLAKYNGQLLKSFRMFKLFKFEKHKDCCSAYPNFGNCRNKFKYIYIGIKYYILKYEFVLILPKYDFWL